jgi:hypothetical protein
MTVPFLANLSANTIIEVVFASAEATMAVTAFSPWVTPADPYDRPGVPSIITTVKSLVV